VRVLTLAAVAATLGIPMTTSAAEPGITSRAVEYRQGDTALEGWLARPAAGSTARPGVLVVPDWTGVGPFARQRAEALAALGYVALAADVYGKGVRPGTPQEAAATAGRYKSDRALLRARVAAGLAELARQPGVDPARLAAIGYCFGGTAAIELARSGAALAGVVSFHGGLDSPTPADGRNIRAKLLVLHGAEDPFVPEADVKAFEAELRAARVDWQMVKYAGAVHSFTNPAAGNDVSRGAAYDAAADRRSWTAMRAFFDEIFAR
jgi:dienelactone hydrolase